MGEKVGKKKKKKGESEEGDKGRPFPLPAGPSLGSLRSPIFCSCFIPLFFSIFVLVFALFPTTEPVLRQTLFFPFQILLQIIAARKGNANVRVPA